MVSPIRRLVDLRFTGCATVRRSPTPRSAFEGRLRNSGRSPRAGSSLRSKCQGAAKVNPEQSGRLELAEWLVNSKNPLTSRVAVNRIWQHLFARGIVATSDNFGVMGDVPSHPELLDHLADRFVRNGWSVKSMVRTIVLTRAYQLSADTTADHQKIDPANKLVWRHSPRRLDSEEIRDAALAASGKLDLSRPAGSPAKELRMVEMRDNGPEARTIHEKADTSTRRGIYLPLLRGVTPHSLEAFDPVEQTLVTGNRDATTVPTQALFLLNSTFVRQQSLALAERLVAEKKVVDESARVQAAYLLTYGRAANQAEIDRALNFLAEYESICRAQLATEPQPKKAEPAKKMDANKPVEPPFDPDQVDQTGEVVRGRSDSTERRPHGGMARFCAGTIWLG